MPVDVALIVAVQEYFNGEWKVVGAPFSPVILSEAQRSRGPRRTILVRWGEESKTLH
ncbi:MAG: hypothetical protein WCA89_13930 [Terracidiphilus sp.]|jgi:hypothetical protein